MKIFIDCEFNGYRGELISMALVAEDGREFYEVVGCDNPVPWVRDNVMPILNKEEVSLDTLKLKLLSFLQSFTEEIDIVADWPEDIKHFCETLIVGPGERLTYPVLGFRTEVCYILCGLSKIPHNALEDARANRLAYGVLFS